MSVLSIESLCVIDQPASDVVRHAIVRKLRKIIRRIIRGNHGHGCVQQSERRNLFGLVRALHEIGKNVYVSEMVPRKIFILQIQQVDGAKHDQTVGANDEYTKLTHAPVRILVIKAS